MDYKIKISNEAEIDIIEALIYYEERKLGLGERFLKTLDESLILISNNPVLFIKKYKELRMYVMRTFPFLIYYLIEEENKEILIFSVLHSKRDPKLIKKRYNK